MTTPLLGLDELSETQASKYLTHNTALRQLEGWLIRIKDRDLATPPGSPAEGDTYLVAASGTGAWSGQDGKLAVYISGAWSFLAPFEGLSLWVNDEDTRITYDGAAWLQEGGLLEMPKNAQSSNYSVLTSDRGKVIVVDTSAGNVTVTLPAAATAGDGFAVAVYKDHASNVLTIDGDGAETINGAATLDLEDYGDSRILVCDGASWRSVGGGGGVDYPLLDNEDLFANNSDQTKILKFALSGLTTATARTATWPDKSGTVAMIDDVTGGGNASTELDEDSGTTTGLTWGFKAGNLRIGNVIHAVSAGTIALTASSTCYVELDPSDQTVKHNTTGFTAGRIPLRQVTTDASSQTVSTDKRAWLNGGMVIYGEGLTENLGCADKVLSRAELKDYAETRTAPSSSSGSLTLDLENGNVFETTLTENITSLTISNPPASGKAGAFTWIVKQDGTGSRTVSWPGSVKWAGGSAPTLTTDANAVDVLTFLTTDAGTTWWGFAAGLNLS